MKMQSIPFKRLCMTIPVILSFTFSAWAGDQVGTLTQIEGKVQLFTNPSKKLQEKSQENSDKGHRALFDGEYYLVRDAQVGDRVEQGNIVRTAIGSKVRVVFDNGDQFNVGSGTAYRVFWNKDSADGQTKMNLMYGKLRGIVAKGGPRSKLQIRTKAATMGVRGTDFFIAEDGATGETEISILRGQVEVKTADAPKAKPVEIATGQSASIVPEKVQEKIQEKTAEKPADPSQSEKVADSKPGKVDVKPTSQSPQTIAKIELRKTTQEELVGIQKSSEIKAEVKPAELPKEVAQKIEKLETKAVETTITDVKQHNPELVAKLNVAEIKSVDQIHAITVQTLYKEAPKAPPTRKKPFMSELENIESGAYERYFKIVE